MRSTKCFAAGFVAIATAAVGFGGVSVQVGSQVGSNGPLGNFANGRITQNADAFTPGRIWFEGDVTSNYFNTYLSELHLYVTTPNGLTANYGFGLVAQPWSGVQHVGPVELTGGAFFPSVPGGTWSFEFGESYDDAGTPDAYWSNITIYVQSQIDQIVPVCLDFGRLLDTGAHPTAVGNGTFTSSPARWYTFRTDGVLASRGEYLEINTLGSDLPPINDTELGLYAFAGGQLVAANDDADALGGVYTSRLRFGAGAGSLGDLLPGRYYVGVTTFPNFFANAPFLASAQGNSLAGSYEVNIDTNVRDHSGPCPGDLDGDRTVGLTDLATLLSNFGRVGATPEMGDLNGDNNVDLTDLATLLSQFGVQC